MWLDHMEVLKLKGDFKKNPAVVQFPQVQEYLQHVSKPTMVKG
jgi:hypothetical protein